MRILTFTSLFPNQQRPEHGIFVYQRVAHLATRFGVHLEVVAPVPYVPGFWRFGRWGHFARVPRSEQIGQLKVHHPRYPLLPKVAMPLHGLLMFLGSLRCIRQIQERMGFDCIDAHYVYPDGLAASLAGKLLGIPVVISARGTDVNVFPSFRLIRPMLIWTLKEAVGVIAVSEALRLRIVSLGIAAAKVKVIGNGTDSDRFHPVKLVSARAHLELPITSPIVLGVGNLIPSKGFDLAIRATAALRAKYPDLLLCIVGEGPEKRQLESLARQLHIDKQVRLLGRRPNQELRYWYSAANITCLPSYREGWPNCVSESLACGTPVVATEVGGIPEIIRDPALGILVKPDEESVTAGLDKALQTPWLHNVIAELGARRTWDTVAEEVFEFLCRSCPNAANRSACSPPEAGIKPAQEKNTRVKLQ